jgi:DNA polymerase-3 subunit beta
MKIKIAKSLLKSALDKCNPILPARATVPAMNCALFVAKDNTLSITVTNMDQRVTAKVECEISDEGETCISFKRLLDWVDKVSGEILMNVSGDVASLVCGNAKSKISCLPASEFVPKPPASKPDSTFKDKDGIVSASLRRVKCAASTEQSRMILNGVHFVTKDKGIRLESSDGRRAHLCEVAIKAAINFTLPTPAVDSAVNLFEECACEYRVFENRLEIISDTTELETKLIEGSFPDVQRIVPETQPAQVRIDKDQLLGAIKVVSPMMSEVGQISLICTKGGVTVTAKNGTDEADVEIEGKQKLEFTTIVNAQFLKETLTALETSEVLIHAKNGSDPLLIVDGDFLAVIMPFRAPANP